MAKRQGKKQHRGDTNSARRNGKAWKQSPKKNGDGSVGKPKRTRSFIKMQARNELGHVIKVGPDGHEVCVCDHPTGYNHEKIKPDIDQAA